MQESRHIGLNPAKYIQAERLQYRQPFSILCHNILCVAMLLSFILLSNYSAIAGNIDRSQLKVKADRAVTLVEKWAAEEKDVSKILPEMQKVKSLGDAGKLDQADALLDKILSLLQAEQIGAPAKSKSSLPAAPVAARRTGSPLAASVPAAAGMSEITIAGAPDHGIFDPSVTSDGTGKLYMSLSGVASTTPGGSFGTAAVRTYLASSGDQGKSWKLASVINPDIAVTLGKAPPNGRWQSEVSALVFNSLAPKQARWKLVWHQYLNINGDRKFEHGWIAYKEAESPGALATAKPVKLFTAAAYDAVNDTTTGWTRSPIAGAGVNKVQQLSPALASCIAVSEPGLLSKLDALYMSQVCFQSGSARHHHRRRLAEMRTPLQRRSAGRMVVCRNSAHGSQFPSPGFRQILGLRPFFR